MISQFYLQNTPKTVIIPISIKVERGNDTDDR